MNTQWSTSLSDGVLATTCLSAVWRVHQASANWHFHFASGAIPIYDTPIFAIAGFFTIFIASAIGVLRFGFEAPSEKLILMYESTSWFASSFGISFLTMQFNLIYGKYFFAWVHLLDLLIVVLASFILPVKMTKILHRLQQTAVIISIVIVSFFHQNWHGVLGAQLVAIAALSIGTQGTLFGFPAVDAFHYTLACALYLLSRAVTIVEA